MLVNSFLEDSARRYPDKVALVAGDERWTYSQLDEAAGRFAAELLARGVKRGDRVVIHLENTVQAVLSVFGTLKAAGVFVLVNPTVKADKLAYILNDCQAAVLIGEGRGKDVVIEALQQARGVRTAFLTSNGAGLAEMPGDSRVLPFVALTDSPESPSEPAVIDLDLAALIYTSGSSGQAKGVMLTHLNIVSAATSIDSYLRISPDDVILDVLPLSFDYGLYQVFLAFRAGARVVLERSLTYVSLMLDAIVRERVTFLPIVPMVAALLLRQNLEAYDLSSLRCITNTGGALPVAHIESLRRQLPSVRVFSMYGLTECKRVSFLEPEEIDSRPTSVGKAMDNVEAYVVDARGRCIEYGVGELVVRGSNVMQGYWGDPESTARVLRPAAEGERVLYTGDIFRIDEDGYLYFVSRTDDVIKCRGQKVSPREVEDVLHAVPGVSEAAVIGVPDDVTGEGVKAFVILKPGAVMSEQELLRHCARRLEDFMIPRTIEIVETLPRTSSGKTARRALSPAFE